MGRNLKIVTTIHGLKSMREPLGVCVDFLVRRFMPFKFLLMRSLKNGASLSAFFQLPFS